MHSFASGICGYAGPTSAALIYFSTTFIYTEGKSSWVQTDCLQSRGITSVASAAPITNLIPP